MAFIALFNATIQKDYLSLLVFSFLSHVQAFWYVNLGNLYFEVSIQFFVFPFLSSSFSCFSIYLFLDTAVTCCCNIFSLFLISIIVISTQPTMLVSPLPYFLNPYSIFCHLSSVRAWASSSIFFSMFHLICIPFLSFFKNDQEYFIKRTTQVFIILTMAFRNFLALPRNWFLIFYFHSCLMV